MKSNLFKSLVKGTNKPFYRTYTLTSSVNGKDHYKLLVAGGGTGGLATASKFARKLGKGNIAIIEPSKYHYYQAGWTMCGGGLRKAEELVKEEEDFIPKSCDWIKSKIEEFDPQNNTIRIENGKKLTYDYLIVAVGIETNFNGIKGLVDALENDPNVLTNYSHKYVVKTFPAIQRFKGGNAIFTFPSTPIKCAGAPQKIMYLAEDYFRKHGVRDKTTVLYNSALPVIFGAKKYADSLTKVIEKRNINVNFRTNLTEIRHDKKEAIFEKLDTPGTFVTFNYDLIHVGPPMKAYDVVKKSALGDASGFVDVDKETLQHKKFPNVFAIGDCSNIPTSKTAAAVASQCQVLFKNLYAVMNGTSPSSKYDGYTSCPLVTGYGKLILAEFDFNGQPLETFPFDQGKERRTMYHLKKDIMPHIYWSGLVKGIWNGPTIIRKGLSLGMK